MGKVKELFLQQMEQSNSDDKLDDAYFYQGYHKLLIEILKPDEQEFKDSNNE